MPIHSEIRDYRWHHHDWNRTTIGIVLIAFGYAVRFGCQWFWCTAVIRSSSPRWNQRGGRAKVVDLEIELLVFAQAEVFCRSCFARKLRIVLVFSGLARAGQGRPVRGPDLRRTNLEGKSDSLLQGVERLWGREGNALQNPVFFFVEGGCTHDTHTKVVRPSSLTSLSAVADNAFLGSPGRGQSCQVFGHGCGAQRLKAPT